MDCDSRGLKKTNKDRIIQGDPIHDKFLPIMGKRGVEEFALIKIETVKKSLSVGSLSTSKDVERC